MAVGNIGGIPKIAERSKGAINPTASPQGAPQKNPHRITGMCIGQSIDPICGTWPVKKGSTNATLKNMAENVRFFTWGFLFIFPLSIRTKV